VHMKAISSRFHEGWWGYGSVVLCCVYDYVSLGAVVVVMLIEKLICVCE
jgi:hypothetical protein